MPCIWGKFDPTQEGYQCVSRVWKYWNNKFQDAKTGRILHYIRKQQGRRTLMVAMLIRTVPDVNVGRQNRTVSCIPAKEMN